MIHERGPDRGYHIAANNRVIRGIAAPYPIRLSPVTGCALQGGDAFWECKEHVIFIEEINERGDELFHFIKALIGFIFPYGMVPIKISEPEDAVSACGPDELGIGVEEEIQAVDSVVVSNFIINIED